MGIFKAYDIRGVVPEEFNADIAYRIGNAVAAYLKPENVVVGRDMRTHSPEIAAAAVRGLAEAGVDVTDIGLASTPAVYFADGFGGFAGALQVTASHNPPEYNGFKLCREAAIPLSYETGIEEIELIFKRGEIVRAESSGRVTEKDFSADYVRHVLGFAQYIRPLTVVADAGNGMAGKYLPLLFKELPCRLEPLYFELDGSFPNHEADPLKEANLADLQARVKEVKADFGVAFDGDGDRVAFVDENGRTISNDLTAALIAREVLDTWPGSTVVYDLRSSMAVAEEIRSRGGRPLESRVGHSYIKQLMRERDAAFGGELSGHYYFRDNFFADSGLIALVMVLNLVSSQEKPLSELVRPLRRYSASGEINFRVEDKEAKIEELARVFSDGEVYFLDGVSARYPDWWFNVRQSNTEPLLRLNLEARSPDLLEEALRRVRAVIEG